MPANPVTKSEPLQRLLRRMRRFLGVALGFTVILNLIALVAPIYMMQVYDRVLSSGSYSTLILLTGIALFLLSLFIAADGGRRRVMANAGRYLGASLDTPTLKAGFTATNMAPSEVSARVVDLSRVQSFLTNATGAPLLDAPFAPMFLAVLFLIHPILGTIGLVGAMVLIAVAVMTERLAREATEKASQKERAAQSELSHMIRQRGAIVSMGMSRHAIRSWRRARLEAADDALEPANLVAFLGATARSIRQMLQVLVLGGGAYLALQQQISAGAIIAGSIIMGRALAPIDQTVGSWRHVVTARASWRELTTFLADNPSAFSKSERGTALPKPKPRLALDDAAVKLPGATEPLIRPVTMALPTGALAVLLGPSGAGKTSLLNVLSAAWPLTEGKVTLGGRSLHSWPEWDRGRHIGYLPQHVQLLTGTVKENIARFQNAPDEVVFEAAQLAGVHELILSLPKAYDTPLGNGGVHVSAGQRQGIGLARALFGNPSLVILDEPTAHLDKPRVQSFVKTLKDFSEIPQAEREQTVLIATHDPRLVNVSDHVLTIHDRQLIAMTTADYTRKVLDLRKEREARAQKAKGQTAMVESESMS